MDTWVTNNVPDLKTSDCEIMSIEFYDGLVSFVTTHQENTISLTPEEVMYLIYFVYHRRIYDVSEITHNHPVKLMSPWFSYYDILFCEKLRYFGFTGKYMLVFGNKKIRLGKVGIL
jgi:hypothetical protein